MKEREGVGVVVGFKCAVWSPCPLWLCLACAVSPDPVTLLIPQSSPGSYYQFKTACLSEGQRVAFRVQTVNSWFVSSPLSELSPWITAVSDVPGTGITVLGNALS